MQVDVSLSQNQKKKLSNFIAEPVGTLSLTLKHSHLDGSDPLYLNFRQATKLEKHKREGKGLVLIINKTIAKLNKQLYGGNVFAQALEIVKPFQQIVGKFVSKKTEDRISRFLGDGLDEQNVENPAFKQGLQLALQGKGMHFKRHIQDAVDEMQNNGSGIGDDIKDFFQGFAYGFSRPDKAFQVLGKLITG